MKGLYKFLILISFSMIGNGIAYSQGSISGSTSVCSGTTTSYTLSGSSYPTGYTWVVPANATLVSGQGTKTISVKFNHGMMGSTIQVSGRGLSAVKSVNVHTPASAGTIYGPSSVCKGGTATFNISPSVMGSNVTQVGWVATNAYVVSQTNTTITVNFPASFTSGEIIAYAIVGNCGPGPYSRKTVTAGSAAPATPGIISGTAVVTPGQTNVSYSIPAIANATSYQWSLPNGATIASGANTKDIKVNFSSAFNGGSITVKGTNSTCNGPASSPYALTLSTLPGTPAYISGNTPCVGASDVLITFTVPPVVNEDPNRYTWTVGPGIIPLGNPAMNGYPFTNTMQVKFPANMTNPTWISVYNSNNAGTGGTATRTLQIYKPAGTPGAISGPSDVCKGQTNVEYSVPPILNASPHVWSLPAGVSYVSGMNTNTITVNFSSAFTSGDIKVYGVNGPCGAGPAAILNVTAPSTPGEVGTVSGNKVVCPGQKNIEYSVTPNANVDFVWSAPAGATIVSGQGTNSIKVNYASSFTGGSFNVHATNGCENGTVSSLYVSGTSGLPVITQHPSSSTWSTGMPDWTIKVIASGSGLTYQWRKNGRIIPGATSSSHTFANIQMGDEANYDVMVTSSTGCTVISNEARLTVKLQRDKNYIITRTVLRDGQFNEDEIPGLPIEDMQMNITYLDGLGRPGQQVSWRGSPMKRDIVKPFVYNELGIRSLDCLPYVPNESNGLYKNVSFAADNDYTHSFYKDPADKIADDTRPFSEIIFEKSPAQRPLKEYLPGKIWHDNAKFIAHGYGVNVHGTAAGQEKIIAWKVNASGLPIRNTALSSGYYPTGRLLIKSTKDENGNEVREYRDNSGKVILTKSYLKGNKTDLNIPGNWAETYYIYDDFYNLRYVLQPELVKALAASATSNPSVAQLSNFAFQYKYDERKRMIEETVPGADVVYMIYNKRNELILTQQGNQRKDGSGNITGKEWSFIKYDAFGRPIMTGIYTHSTVLSQAAMASYVSTYNFYETFTGAPSTHGYSNISFPNINMDVHTVTFYDDYGFKSLLDHANYNYKNSEITGQEHKENLKIKGLVTGSKLKVLGSTKLLWSINYYDDKRRPIQQFAENIQGHDLITNLYNFTGWLLETKLNHSGQEQISTKRKFNYDHAGRLTAVYHSINGETPVLLAKKEYNEIGQLVANKLHSENQGSSYLQVVDYLYNIRGWLTHINNSALNGGEAGEPEDYFGMELAYNTTLGTGNEAQYNGNISGVKWSVNLGLADVKENAYNYTYDPLNRIQIADFKNKEVGWKPSTGEYKVDNIDYDLNGNILSLSRKGEGAVNMDALTYNYGNAASRSNKLLKVSDGGSEEGFKDGNTSGNDYAYDANGNMTRDLNKGISSITYNYLNLPEVVTKNDGRIKYIYDASGTKLAQEVYSASNQLVKRSDYVGALMYEDNALQFIQHEEGRVMMVNDEGLGIFPEYQYHLKDHLGNVRLTFTSKPEVDITEATLETADALDDRAEFLYYDNVTKINAALFNHTGQGHGSSYSIRLNGTENEEIGLARSLAVMPGDVIKAEVFAKYLDPNPNNWTQALANLMAAIAAGTTTPGTVVEGVPVSEGEEFPFANLLDADKVSETGPLAFLNVLIFDKNFNFLDGMYVPVTTEAKEDGNGTDHERVSTDEIPEIKIAQAGYVMVYLSNDNPSPVEVYFDDFTVEHVHSAIVQADDYYPFGLTFNSASRENGFMNKYLYNGVELNPSIGVYETMFRQYDPALGRFSRMDPLADIIAGMSPYHFGFNNPIRFNDPLGLMGEERVGADGLTNSQWLETSRPGASPGLRNQYRSENRAKEKEKSHLNNAINNALNGNIEGLESAGLSGYYTANSRGYIYKVHIYGFGSTYNAQSGGNPITPWEVGWEWLTGTGPRHRNFTNGDYFTEMLKQHDHIAVIRNKIANGGALEGRAPYNLSGVQGVGKYLKDYSTLTTGGLTGNIAVTYLGSYVLTWQGTVDGNVANIVFSVTNSSTIQSATRPPVIGYTQAWQSTVGAWLNQQLSSGPMSPTTQTFRWTETIPIR